MDLEEFRPALDAWLDEHGTELTPPPGAAETLDDQMDHLARVKRLTYEAGWMRWGWPERVGGLGGSTLLRAYLGEALTSRDLVEPGIYSMTEVLAPTMIDYARPELAADHGPASALRGGDLVPGVLRARHRQQSRPPCPAGPPATVSVAGHRPEGLDQPGPVRPPLRPPHPHRHPRIGPPRDHRPLRRHGQPGHRGPAHRDHARRPGVLRGLLRRRGRAPRPHPRRGGPGLVGGHGPAPLRAEHGPVAPGRLSPPTAPGPARRGPRGRPRSRPRWARWPSSSPPCGPGRGPPSTGWPGASASVRRPRSTRCWWPRPSRPCSTWWPTDSGPP